MNAEPATQTTNWLRSEVIEGVVVFRSGTCGERLVAEWPSFARLTTARDGGDVDSTFAEGIPEAMARRLRHGPVRALTRHAAGYPTLHGSAASLAGVTLACVGESGAGKSTTIASLSAKDGVELVADDTVFLEFAGDEVRVEPSQEVAWLRADASTFFEMSTSRRVGEKTPWDPPRRGASPRRLDVIAKLSWGDSGSVRTSELRGAEAFRALSLSLFKFVHDDPRVGSRDLDFLARIVRSTRVIELVRPRSLEALPAVCEALLHELEGARSNP